ncbi:hypothetical protein A8V01_02615 [Novosphingobium guangzhouense]|uniref:Uncharacterized protein n=1 Tax=Novosphingobium guangzhouense TaxID=1850347 RepID=A0A2K2G5Y7_9SPHN|nr:hypothetical protein A8V01_02615 [Novosphingobium guangzhouense]
MTIFHGRAAAEGEALPKFRTYLPHLSLVGCTIGADDWQAEGWTLTLRWLGMVFEWTVACEDATR